MINVRCFFRISFRFFIATTTTTQTTTATTTSTTSSSCGTACSRTPISSASRLAYYKFESNTNDLTGNYPASGLSSPTYTTGYAGSGIYLNGAPFEQLITSSMNLSSRSFTIELWFYLTRIPTQDNAFFGQQSIADVGKYCLFLMSRLGRLYMGFYADDTTGGTTLQNATWYHAAFVYDHDLRQRWIYLNGLVDGQSTTGVGPYLGSTGSMTIGSAKIDGTIGTPFFSGYLDELMISTRVKSACEIMNDASLAAYFPLDNSYTDAGPNSLSLTSSGASFIVGYTNQGVYLSGTNSYVQIGGLTGLGRSNNPYSIAFWVRPVVKGVLVHISANSSGKSLFLKKGDITFILLFKGLGWCTPLITFDLSGQIVSQVYNPGSSISLTGPILSTTAWSHVVQTYSPTNGQRLYINGVLYTSSSASTIYQASENPNYLTFGNMLLGVGICVNPTPVVAVFQGGLDELRVYNRELSSVGVCLLAQP